MANTEISVIENIKNNSIVIREGNEYKVPVSSVIGRGLMEKTESFGGLSLLENAERTDKAIQNMQPLQNVWNHSHSQWTWKHITLGFYSDWRNMKQIEAEMSRKRSALNETKWRCLKNEIKIRKMEEQLEDDSTPLDYWKEIELKVKIAELKEGISEGTSYIEGAMKDVLALNEIYEQLKARVANFTEEDFEREESKSHLKRSLSQCIRDVRQFGFITKGEQEYMEQIGVNPTKMLQLIKVYLNTEETSSDWSTDGMVEFINKTADDLIDNKKVDVKRMAAMGLDHEPTLGIGYDKPVAERNE